jgi:uncharacterized membrane protein (DUF4010 family)
MERAVTAVLMATHILEKHLTTFAFVVETVIDAVVERNSALPEKVPDGGLIFGRCC